jgi:hypothetical protein
MVAFFLLGVIWAAVLLPPWLQSRREARPTASMVAFRRQLGSLARTSPAYAKARGVHVCGFDDRAAAAEAYEPQWYEDDDEDVEPAPERRFAHDPLAHRRGPVGGRDPSGRESVRRAAGAYHRRRRITSGLALLTSGAVAPAVVVGGAWWTVLAVAGGLLVTYVGLLARRHRRLVERAQKVRHLPPIRAPRPPVVVLGASAAR